MNIEEDDLSGRWSSSATGWATSTSAETTGATWAWVTGLRAVLPGLTHQYTGPITFESFSSAVVAPGLSNDLAVWRNLERRRRPAAPQFITEQAVPQPGRRVRRLDD
jgi:hypothetical protein